MNGQPFDFFKSLSGLKQGNPLWPTLFIIATEILSRRLNQLNDDNALRGFGLPKWSPKINHLPYANDTILFCSEEKCSIIKIKKVLRNYETCLGQMINLGKKLFLSL